MKKTPLSVRIGVALVRTAKSIVEMHANQLAERIEENRKLQKAAMQDLLQRNQRESERHQAAMRQLNLQYRRAAAAINADTREAEAAEGVVDQFLSSLM